MFLYLLFFEIFCLQITRKKEHFSSQIEQKPILRIQIYTFHLNKTKKRPVSLLTEHKSFETEVFRTPDLVKAQHFWGRSLRLLYGGGRSALYGGAPVGRFMGCAESF